MRSNLTLVSTTAVGLACLACATDASAIEPRVASEMVTLIADSSTPLCPTTSAAHRFNDRLMPDGSRTSLTIPATRVLVITSYDWLINESTQAGGTVYTSVALFDGSGYVHAVSSGAAADSAGWAAGGAVVPSGLAVKSGTVMCLNVLGGSGTGTSARVHGFLADNR